MLKIVYPICCGMDVHKSFVVACIATTNDHGVTNYKSKRFSTFTGDLRRCADWLSENNCKDVCMESTGKYWIPIYNILEHTCNIVLAHPKYVKAIRGKKTDKRDAKWIADIFKHDLVSGSFIPPADIRQLRDLVRYHWKLTNFNVGEKNRAQNCLTVSNIKLDDVFSDVFGKAASAITTRLLNSVYTRSSQNSTPNSNATNLHSSQKRCCSFCISSSNASPTFQVQKSIFHQMTKPIQVTVILPLLLAISFSRNDDIHSSISGISNDLIGVIPTIGQ